MIAESPIFPRNRFQSPVQSGEIHMERKRRSAQRLLIDRARILSSVEYLFFP